MSTVYNNIITCIHSKAHQHAIKLTKRMRKVVPVDVNAGGILTSRLMNVINIVDCMYKNRNKSYNYPMQLVCNIPLTVSPGLDANQAVQLYVNAGIKLPYKKETCLL